VEQEPIHPYGFAWAIRELAGGKVVSLARQIAPVYNPQLVFPERHHPPLNQPA